MARCRVPAPVAGGGTVNPRLPHGDISRVLHRVLVLTGGGGHVLQVQYTWLPYCLCTRGHFKNQNLVLNFWIDEEITKNL